MYGQMIDRIRSFLLSQGVTVTRCAMRILVTGSEVLHCQ
jgi:hypothetical protein